MRNASARPYAISMGFGKRLGEARRAAGMTGAELGKRVGVTKQAISHWENGVHPPDLDQLATLCRVLGVTSDYLLLGVAHGLSLQALRVATGYDNLTPEEQTRWAAVVDIVKGSGPREFAGDSTQQHEQGASWGTEKRVGDPESSDSQESAQSRRPKPRRSAKGHPK